MEAEIQTAEIDASHEVLAPSVQHLPLVFASPHSGNRYPHDFVAQSRLDRLTLRRSEDCFVDDLFGAAPQLGAPLLRAMNATSNAGSKRCSARHSKSAAASGSPARRLASRRPPRSRPMER